MHRVVSEINGRPMEVLLNDAPFEHQKLNRGEGGRCEVWRPLATPGPCRGQFWTPRSRTECKFHVFEKEKKYIPVKKTRRFFLVSKRYYDLIFLIEL